MRKETKTCIFNGFNYEIAITSLSLCVKEDVCFDLTISLTDGFTIFLSESINYVCECTPMFYIFSFRKCIEKECNQLNNIL